MICPVCKKETPDNRQKCMYCGTEIKRKTSPSLGQGTGKPGIPPGDSQRKQVSQPPGTPDQTRVTPPGAKDIAGAVPQNDQRKPPIPGTPTPEKTQLSSGAAPKHPDMPSQKKQDKPGISRDEKEGKTQITPGAIKRTPETPSSDSKPKAPSTPGKSDRERSNEEVLLQDVLTGRYEILGKLGSGGMASVYLARELALDRKVAIKLLPQAFLRDEQFVARFKREAQISAQLEHPNIVRIYQIIEEKNLVFFMMSYIPGGTLTEQTQKRGSLPVEDIIKWGMDVSSALYYAHEHGVIHRDLKPDNIMIDNNGNAVVMDFGIARAAQGSSLTQTGAVIGTPQYMSPEQARGVDLDARSDIYSMGMVLYQMATTTVPFEGTDAASLMYKHVHEKPEPPDVRNEDVPPWLRDIILKCLSKNPVDRFNDAEELRQALAQQKAPELFETILMEGKKSARNKKIVMYLVAAVVVAGLAIGGWLWRSSALQKIEQANIDKQALIDAQKPEVPAISPDDLSFQNAKMVNSKLAFNTYLTDYPQGRHVKEARDKITEIEKIEAAESEKKTKAAAESNEQRQQRIDAERRADEEKQVTEARDKDDQAYQFASMSNTKHSYTTYLESYPDGLHTDEARAKIADIEKKETEAKETETAEQTRRDNDAFNLALNTNTKDSYSNYLISHPDGQHSADARSKITAIDELTAFEKKINLDLSELSIIMVEIPDGSFQMGSEKGDGDEKPVRTVTLSGFRISTTEVTQTQYEELMGDNPAFHKLDDNCPVERVTWEDAIKYCNKLSEKLNMEPCYNISTGDCDFSKNGFRLPTEAEWEFACRANRGTEYNTGDGESALARAGWYTGNSGEKTHPAGQKAPNSFGLYDMHGNVWEWCNDKYSKNSYKTGKKENPTGLTTGSDRVLRGGSWLDWPKDCRSTNRRNFKPDKNYSDIGFRIVRR